MRILILDQDAVGASLAYRAAELGHRVDWFIEPKPDNFADITGKGLHKNIRKVTEWIPSAGRSDLILTTSNGSLLKPLERFRKKGIAVFAPTQEAADLEIKRGAGLKFFERHKLPVPEYKTFGSLAEAEAFVMKNEEPWVFKTLGDNDDKSLSYVSSSAAQMVQQLRSWQKQGLNPKGQVLLQKKIDGIAEMSVSSYVGPNGFNGPFIHTWEHKKLMNDEKGPNTGEMGSILQIAQHSQLADEVLKPLEEELASMGAFCNFDLNCIIDKEGQPWILEATSRFGWPATNIELELFEDDPFEQMVDVCHGTDTIQLSPQFAAGVVLTIPDFPYSQFERDQVVGIPIYGITDENRQHIHPQSVMAGTYLDEDMEDTDGWVTAGSYVAVVTGKGNTVKAAQKAAYGIVDELKVSNVMFRTDIGDKVIKALPKLEQFGYIESDSETLNTESAEEQQEESK